MKETRWSRRDFLRTSATAAAGMVVFPAIPTVYAGNPTGEKTSHILNYNEQMEYRRAGKTGLMVSAVCLGGHWKRVNKVVPGLFPGGSWLSAKLDDKDFEKNRYDVVTRCIERGINYIDACTKQEVIMYAKALKGRRDKMYLGFSWYQEEMRSLSREMAKAAKEGKPKPPGWITRKLKEALDHGFKATGLDYVDLWRITLFEHSSQHTDDQMWEMIAALDWAKKTGRARFTGFSSHDRPHIKRWIELASDHIDAVCTPYTAKSRLQGAKIEVAEEGRAARVVAMPDNSWKNSLWYTFQKYDIAWFGIKPFASGSMFKGDSSPGNPHEQEDNKIARLTLRAILTNPVITAPIPGMITPEQVDNAALAVLQRRALDVKEQAALQKATDEAFANLPPHYRWLNDWNIV
ncbi:MAG: aldo/keto reductase [Verrucomicrobia bacterium]|nr:MAG: aldo/keto reductase [Verrucomicrobiota bacterium]